MKNLYIIRGCSNSGKTTFAEYLAMLIDSYEMRIVTHVEADDYFTTQKGFNQPEYNFDATKIHLAHKDCISRAREAMEHGDIVIVSNTTTTEKDLKIYLDLAKEFGYNVTSMIMERRHDNLNDHGVPEETMKKQENNLRNSIKLR